MVNKDLYDIVEKEDSRTVDGEFFFKDLLALRGFRGNYGVPRQEGKFVIKGFFSSDEKELDRLENLHDNYVAEVRKFMPVLRSKTMREGNLFYLKQPFIEGQTFEGVLQGDSTDEFKMNSYRELLTQALNLVTQSDKIVGVDGKPENWMYDKGSWTFIDTFPPFLIDDENSFADIFNLRGFERDFATKPSRTYFRDPAKVIRRLWLKSEKLEPSLDYRELSLDVAKTMDLPARVYKTISVVK